MENALRKFEIHPMDEHNLKLVENVHPSTWENATPSGRYNLVVIGAGTAGLVTAAAAAGLGAKVALIEKHFMGGDCLNVGCVPSKCLISAGKVAALTSRYAADYGVKTREVSVDFAAVMERMRRLRASISPHDSVKRFSDLGIDIYLGQASFIDSSSIDVAGTQLKFKKAVICSGARAVELPIPGLAETGYLTNETVFSLTELPKRLAVIGAGPIGCELAQAFLRFGSEVYLLQDREHILPREDADAAAVVQDKFRAEGMNLVCCTTVKKIEQKGDEKIVHYEAHGKQESVAVDELLVAVGRAPNVEGMNLEKVGVDYGRHGIKVSDNLRTTNPRIYAAGDICMKWKFTHAADFAARIVIQNSLFFGRKKLSTLTMPWCTYTEPEIAHVGLYEHEAKENGIEIDTYRRDFKDVDRAIAEGDTEGFVKVHTKKGNDEILGATIVGSIAGDMISELSVAIVNKVGLGKIANVIHPYPTKAEAIRQCGDAYNKTRLTPIVSRFFRTWLRLIR